MQTEGPYSNEFSIVSVTGPTVAPDNIIDVQPEIDDDASTPTGSGGSSTTVTTYSHTTTVSDEPVTTNLWWPFFGLAVFTGGAAWFMRK